MTIFRRPSGRYTFDFTRQGRRYTASGFRSKQEAGDAQAIRKGRVMDARLAKEYGLRPSRAHLPTIRAFIETDWLPGLKSTLARSTYTNARSHAKKLTKAFGLYRIGDLTLREVESWRDARLKEISGNQFREDLKWLRAMLRAAGKRGYGDADPTKGIRLPTKTQPTIRILSQAEEQALLAAIRVHTIQQMVRFALLTGCRRQDLCRLIWQDVDLQARRLFLVQQKTQEPKVLPLLPEAVALLRQLKPGIAHASVFRSPRGGHYYPLAVTQNFIRACRRAKIGRMRFHDLRHTVAIRLLEAGCDIPTVGMILGHKPPYHTTLRYLAHTTRARAEKALASLQKHSPKSTKAGKTPIMA